MSFLSTGKEGVRLAVIICGVYRGHSDRVVPVLPKQLEPVEKPLLAVLGHGIGHCTETDSVYTKRH